MKFKTFNKSLTIDAVALNEAKFNTKNLRKVSDILAKIGSKKLGTKFSFAWADNFKKSSGVSGSGVRYLASNGTQIRFNHVTIKNNFAINSVDYWKLGDGFTEPSISLYFEEGINIVHLKEKLFDAIITGKAPKVSSEEAAELGLTEASAAAIKKQNRIDFANAKGIPKTYANSDKIMRVNAEKRGLLDEYIDYMEVKKGDSEKTEFDAKITKDQKKLSSTSSEYFADPKYVFEDMQVAAMTVAKKLWRSLIIAGMGGIGKTFGVKQVLTQNLGPYGEGIDSKWAFYEGLKTSPMGLFNILLLNKRKLIVFDDSDSVFGNNDMVNMMKIATSDSGDRTISWVSKATANVALMSREEREIYEMDYIEAVMEDPNTNMKAPSSFNFEGQIIVISNLKASKFDDAIKSRSIFIDLYLAQRDVLRRMATIMEYEGDSPEDIKEILEAIDEDAMDALAGKGTYGGEVKYVTAEIARKNKGMNMRTVNITKALRKSGHPDWRRMSNLYS